MQSAPRQLIPRLADQTSAPLSLVQGMALPVILQWTDVLLIMLSAVLLTALAVIYPAWRAVQVEPAAVLRDE